MLYTVVKYRVRIVRIIPYRNLGLYTTLIEMTKKIWSTYCICDLTAHTVFYEFKSR